MFQKMARDALNRITSTPAFAIMLVVMILVGMLAGFMIFWLLLSLFELWVLKSTILCLSIAFYALYQDRNRNVEAFKWRKRWIIERFGAGVEGNEGDYFVTTNYSSGLPCFIFSAKREPLTSHGLTVRKWNNMMGCDLLSENCDLPDERTMGLPVDPTKDIRPWVPAGPGLCRVPRSLVERAVAARSKRDEV